MIKTINIYNQTIELLNKLGVKHQTHNFPSGVIMLDIWHNDSFYVLQFESTFIGFSEVNDNNLGFDNIPDEKIYDAKKVRDKLKLILTI